jgi:hypothetical protein
MKQQAPDPHPTRRMIRRLFHLRSAPHAAQARLRAVSETIHALTRVACVMTDALQEPTKPPQLLTNPPRALTW